MIDFQDERLEPFVHQVMIKMNDIVLSDKFPRFKTKKAKDGTWECKLKIPGLQVAVVKYEETEIKAINRCARKMLHILNCQTKEGLYDPTIEESVYRDRLECFFGDIDYDKEYYYYMTCHSETLYMMDDYMHNYFKRTFHEMVENIHFSEDDELVDTDGEFIARFLIRRKKKNYC